MLPASCLEAAILLLILSYNAPASRSRLFDEVVRHEHRRDLETVSRGLDEDPCVPLLRPHIPKVSHPNHFVHPQSSDEMLCVRFFTTLFFDAAQVALMFLVRGEIYHEEVWTEWIGNLAGSVPSSILCEKALEQCYRDMQHPNWPPRSVYDEQSFFNIVVHTKPHFTGYAKGSIFDGRIVDERIEVGSWNPS